MPCITFDPVTPHTSIGSPITFDKATQPVRACNELHTAATYTEDRCAADILLCEDVTVVYKAVGDLIFFVTGASAENEIILFTVLSTLTDALDNLLRCGASRFWTSFCVYVLDAVQ